MNPEHWKQINRIYHDALEIKADQRASFLIKACGGNQKLLRQVNDLIEAHEQASRFLELPAAEIAAKVIADEESKKVRVENGARVFLTIVKGPREGKTLSFSGHKICVFGRANDCFEILPEEDPTVGRHHFMLEINTPEVALLDLGSLNGTYVNGRRIGSNRDKNISLSKQQSLPLHHGDKIQVGDTVLQITTAVPVSCAVCGRSTKLSCPGNNKNAPTALCRVCSVTVLEAARHKAEVKLPTPKVKCDCCKKVYKSKTDAAEQNGFLCDSCRQRLESDKKAMKKFLDTTSHSSRNEGTPLIKGFEFTKTMEGGRLGISYIAEDKSAKRKVMVKVVSSKLVPEIIKQTELLSRFDEIRDVRHVNVIELVDYGSASNMFYVVSDYCNGGNIRDLMARQNGKIGSSEAIPIMLQALEGLAFIHSKGMFHGDLNPENILLATREGRTVAKLSDFSLSYNLHQAGICTIALTEDGRSIPFTPSELLTGSGNPGPAGDIWSIAAVFYFMLTGRLPYGTQMETGTLGALMESKVTPVDELCPDLMPEIAQMINVSLGPSATRYRHAGEMVDMMKKIQNRVLRLTLAT
jgi:eukaryotic-like serine/threonine-protein kinase